MTAKVYVVMKQRQHAIIRFAVMPHEVYSTKKEAISRAKHLNEVAMTNYYWVEPAPMIAGAAWDL